jgi:hypothetical protein
VKEELEAETKCRIVLRGRAAEKNPPINLNMYIEINGNEPEVDHAKERIEDLLVESLEGLDNKRLLMHDIASSNKNLYNHSENLIFYQREPFDARSRQKDSSRKWMRTLGLPRSMPDHGRYIIMGPKCQGIREIVGDTKCLVRIMKNQFTSQGLIYISGNSVQSVEICTAQAKQRIRWAISCIEQNTT